MAVLKGAEVDRFLAAPDPARPIVLIHGSDQGLVAERARRLAGAVAPDLDDPFSVVRLEGDAIAGDPGRLLDEAATVPMFGGRRLVWVKGGDKPLNAAIAAILAAPPRGCTVLLELADLKKGPARTEAERSAHAAVIACYADTAADLRRIAAEDIRAAGLTIDPAALSLLVSLLGGDRGASRAEIAKLCLYAQGRGEITAADVEAVAGDSLTLGIDEIVDAATGGDLAALDRLMMRAAAGGVAAQPIIGALGRHVAALHKARLAVEGGLPAAQAVERFDPPLFFKRRALVERQLARWSSDRLQRLMARIAEAAFEARVKADLAPAIAGRTLITVALAARPQRG